VTTASPETEADVKRTVAIYKKLRPYMLGDFYPLFPHDASEEQWYGYQFDRPDLGSGYALVFRREKSADASKEIRLKGLDPKATYEVSFEDIPDKRTATGRELTEKGLTVKIADKPGAVIIMYSRAK
jgi:alpha-galactosidase